MTNQEQMYHHLTQAEVADRWIASIEEVASNEVQRRYHHRIANLNSDQERKNARFFYLKRVLNENPWYTKAAGDRTYHMTAATMYGIAALVDRISVPSVTETQS